MTFNKAHDWYERRLPGLGDEFLLAIADALSGLEGSPERFPVYHRGFRRALPERFPYKLFYRIQGKAVIVFRIPHAVRDHTRELQR